MSNSTYRLLYGLFSAACLFSLWCYSTFSGLTEKPNDTPPRTALELKYIEGTSVSSSPVSCGLICAAACARYYGSEVDFPMLWKAASWTQRGLTMLEVKRLLESELSLQAHGCRISSQKLISWQGPAVLWVQGGRVEAFPRDHYIAYVGPGKSGELCFLDPNRGVFSCSESDLVEFWNGECLLVSDRLVEDEACAEDERS